MIHLGEAFRPPPDLAPPSREEQLLARVLVALDDIRNGLATLPAPVVQPPEVVVPEPDFSELLQAVAGLKPGATAEEIADALAKRLAPRDDTSIAQALERVVSGLESLNNRFKGMSAPAFGASGPSNIADNPDRELGKVTLKGDSSGLLADIKRAVTDFEVRLDYATRTDSNPVYVGKAKQGSLTSDANAWTIQKITYDTSNRSTRVEVLVGAWDNRANLAW